MEIKTKTKKKIIALILCVFLFPGVASAASLFISPNTGQYSAGQTFTVGVYVTSADQPLNAVSGVLDFPADRLQVSSVSRNNSIIDLWVQEPSFSNTSGTVNFEGLVLNPGYQGSNGRVLTVTFRVSSGGQANLRFTSGSVLANDGNATAILESLGTASFALEIETTGPVSGNSETPSSSAGTPSAPLVISDTHPDPDAWYNLTRAEFSWDSSGASATRVLVGSLPQSEPSVEYVPAIFSREIEDLEEGTWYFHVRQRNSNGWGAITHFRFQIDTTNPEYFEILPVERQDSTDPNVQFTFDAFDELSGIQRYEVQIDNNESEVWVDDGTGVYTTDPIGPGRHTLVAKAYDGAGNYLADFAEFFIDPIDSPTLYNWSKEMSSSDVLLIKGHTYPNSQVLISLQKGSEEPQRFVVTSDASGEFSYVGADRLSDGVYKVWTEVIDERGARSYPSDPEKILVQKPTLLRIGSLAISVLAVLIPLIALVFLLLALLYYIWSRSKTLRTRISRETKHAETTLGTEFKDLRKMIAKNLKLIDRAGKKRMLTKEEQMFYNELSKELDITEKALGKELKGIKKQLR